MKKILVLIMCASTTVCAQTWNWRDAHSKFQVPENRTDLTQRVRWQAVDDANAVCNAVNINRTGKPIGYRVEGCQFMENNECVIITGKITNIANLGHEVLHCFWGSYH